MEALSGASSSSPSSVEFVFYDDFEYEFVDEVERLSNWELLDASDADFEMYGNGGDEEERENCSVRGRVPEDLRQMMISPVVAVPISLAEERIGDRLDDVYLLQNQEEVSFAYGYDEAEEEEETDGDVDDDGDESDLDDELVPWSVSDKFGRQRIRKLGKRGFTKMYNSKRSPFLFTKPGCVRGKHGLGLKHSY